MENCLHFRGHHENTMGCPLPSPLPYGIPRAGHDMLDRSIGIEFLNLLTECSLHHIKEEHIKWNVHPNS